MILNAEQRKVIKTICHGLLFGFAGRDATENGDSNNACITKDFGELIENMQKVMNFRARFHADHVALSEAETGSLYVALMNDWLKVELREDQKYKPRREQTSIFAAWTRNSFGSKPFFTAMLQAGLTIFPLVCQNMLRSIACNQTARRSVSRSWFSGWLALQIPSCITKRKTARAKPANGQVHNIVKAG